MDCASNGFPITLDSESKTDSKNVKHLIEISSLPLVFVFAPKRRRDKNIKRNNKKRRRTDFRSLLTRSPRSSSLESPSRQTSPCPSQFSSQFSCSPFSSTLITFFTWFAPSKMPLDANNNPHTTSSFTAFAFAPGVLNTGIPLHPSLSPECCSSPRRISRSLEPSVSLRSLAACASWKMIAISGSGKSDSSPATLYFPCGNFSKPVGAIALNVFTLNDAPVFH